MMATDIDDEIMDLFMEASIQAISPKQYTDGIKQLIEQRCVEARIDELEWALNGAEAVANHPLVSVSYIRDRLAQLKEKA